MLTIFNIYLFRNNSIQIVKFYNSYILPFINYFLVIFVVDYAVFAFHNYIKPETLEK
jgi:hypothetical protein